MRGRETNREDGIRVLPSFLLFPRLLDLRLASVLISSLFSIFKLNFPVLTRELSNFKGVIPIKFVAAEAGFLPSVPLIFFADILAGFCFALIVLQKESIEGRIEIGFCSRLCVGSMAF